MKLLNGEVVLERNEPQDLGTAQERVPAGAFPDLWLSALCAVGKRLAACNAGHSAYPVEIALGPLPMVGVGYDPYEAIVEHQKRLLAMRPMARALGIEMIPPEQPI